MAKISRGVHDMVNANGEVNGISDVIDKGSNLKPQITALTLKESDNGNLFTNEGATAIVPFVLPTAVAGYRFGFIVQDADGIRVTAATGDTIRDGASVSGAAGKIESTAIGSAIEIIALNATEWFVINKTGTWAVT